MDRFYIMYKERVLAGPLPAEDAEQKLVKLKQCFRNVKMMPEAKVKPQREQGKASGN